MELIAESGLGKCKLDPDPHASRQSREARIKGALLVTQSFGSFWDV